jgi:hypothetical protein
MSRAEFVYSANFMTANRVTSASSPASPSAPHQEQLCRRRLRSNEKERSTPQPPPPASIGSKHQPITKSVTEPVAISTTPVRESRTSAVFAAADPDPPLASTRQRDSDPRSGPLNATSADSFHSNRQFVAFTPLASVPQVHGYAQLASGARP